MPSEPVKFEHIVINQLLDPRKYNIESRSLESKQERTARLEKEAKAETRVWLKEIILTLYALIMVGMLGIGCTVIAFGKAGSADDKKWAMAVLSALAAGPIGFLFGKKAA